MSALELRQFLTNTKAGGLRYEVCGKIYTWKKVKHPPFFQGTINELWFYGVMIEMNM